MQSRRFVLTAGAAGLALGALGCSGLGRGSPPAPAPRGGGPRSEEGDPADRAPRGGRAGKLVEISERVNGVERTALLMVPTGWSNEKKWPLLLASHGSGGTGDIPAHKWGWAALCDREGWVGVFPNTGREITGDREDAYFPVLVERLTEERAVDPARVYAVGFSGGQGRVYTFAARSSGMVAAIAGGGGKIGFEEMDPNIWDPRANKVRPVSVLHFHGKKDTTTPVEGGRVADEVTGDNYTIVSMREGLRIWAEANGATLERNARLPAGVPKDCSFLRYRAPSGHLVEGILDPNLHHAWPDWGTAVVFDFFNRVPARS